MTDTIYKNNVNSSLNNNIIFPVFNSDQTNTNISDLKVNNYNNFKIKFDENKANNVTKHQMNSEDFNNKDASTHQPTNIKKDSQYNLNNMTLNISQNSETTDKQIKIKQDNNNEKKVINNSNSNNNLSNKVSKEFVNDYFYSKQNLEEAKHTTLKSVNNTTNELEDFKNLDQLNIHNNHDIMKIYSVSDVNSFKQLNNKNKNAIDSNLNSITANTNNTKYHNKYDIDKPKINEDYKINSLPNTNANLNIDMNRIKTIQTNPNNNTLSNTKIENNEHLENSQVINNINKIIEDYNKEDKSKKNKGAKNTNSKETKQLYNITQIKKNNEKSNEKSASKESSLLNFDHSENNAKIKNIKVIDPTVDSGIECISKNFIGSNNEKNVISKYINLISEDKVKSINKNLNNNLHSLNIYNTNTNNIDRHSSYDNEYIKNNNDNNGNQLFRDAKKITKLSKNDFSKSKSKDKIDSKITNNSTNFINSLNNNKIKSRNSSNNINKVNTNNHNNSHYFTNKAKTLLSNTVLDRPKTCLNSDFKNSQATSNSRNKVFSSLNKSVNLRKNSSSGKISINNSVKNQMQMIKEKMIEQMALKENKASNTKNKTNVKGNSNTIAVGNSSDFFNIDKITKRDYNDNIYKRQDNDKSTNSNKELKLTSQVKNNQDIPNIHDDLLNTINNNNKRTFNQHDINDINSNNKIKEDDALIKNYKENNIEYNNPNKAPLYSYSKNNDNIPEYTGYRDSLNLNNSKVNQENKIKTDTNIYGINSLKYPTQSTSPNQTITNNMTINYHFGTLYKSHLKQVLTKNIEKNINQLTKSINNKTTTNTTSDNCVLNYDDEGFPLYDTYNTNTRESKLIKSNNKNLPNSQIEDSNIKKNNEFVNSLINKVDKALCRSTNKNNKTLGIFKGRNKDITGKLITFSYYFLFVLFFYR